MFTGLIQRIGTVRRVSRGAGLVLEIECGAPDAGEACAGAWAKPLSEGESVAVNGVCLTVVKCDGSRFTADVLRETEERTGLGGLVPGEKVNLERALRAGDAMGGHIVQGHVDRRGTVVAKEPRGRDFRLRIQCGRVFAAGCLLKGSVAVNGVSLTISDLGEDWLAVDVIPTTARETTIGTLRAGDEVNLEGDVLGKYAAKAAAGPGLTEEALARAGFFDA